MGERYITIKDLIKEQNITINERMYTADIYGIISVSESMIFTSEFTVTEFEKLIAEKINDAMQIGLYSLWGRSGYIQLGSTTSVLDGNRDLAKELLAIGIKCRVLFRGHNSDYKVATKILKERMIMVSERINDMLENKPVMNAEEVLHKGLQDKSYKLDEEIEEQKEYSEAAEETIHNPDIDESVKSTLTKTDLQKKTGIVPSRKPALSKTLVKKKKSSKSLKA